jgi:hypothetical protein
MKHKSKRDREFEAQVRERLNAMLASVSVKPPQTKPRWRRPAPAPSNPVPRLSNRASHFDVDGLLTMLEPEDIVSREHALEHLLAATRQLGDGPLRIEMRHVGGSHAVSIEANDGDIVLTLQGTA